jgi:hypothetical protein
MVDGIEVNAASHPITLPGAPLNTCGIINVVPASAVRLTGAVDRGTSSQEGFQEARVVHIRGAVITGTPSPQVWITS